jgi:hypothetical protein
MQPTTPGFITSAREEPKLQAPADAAEGGGS